jgi:hypothetical protein
MPNAICPQCHRMSYNARGVCYYCHPSECPHDHETIAASSGVVLSVCVLRCSRWARETVQMLSTRQQCI